MFLAIGIGRTAILAMYKPIFEIMNIQETREKILSIIKEKGEISPQEINYQTKIAFVQIYSIVKILEAEKFVEIIQQENTKVYRLFKGDKDKAISMVEKPKKLKTEKKGDEIKLKEKKKLPLKTGSRDLTQYKFNGNMYNKGRLAHAIILSYAKEHKPTLKNALLLFTDDIVPPYGVIKAIKEAKEMSKNRARFFIKDEEVIKLKDAQIAVSNQFTPDRIARVISIARKELKYVIK